MQEITFSGIKFRASLIYTICICEIKFSLKTAAAFNNKQALKKDRLFESDNFILFAKTAFSLLRRFFHQLLVRFSAAVRQRYETLSTFSMTQFHKIIELLTVASVTSTFFFVPSFFFFPFFSP